MNIDEITTYHDIDEYIERVGATNLTDEDIEALCSKIRKIKQREIDEIKRKAIKPAVKEALIMAQNSIAINKIRSLHNCTYERFLKRKEKIRKAQEANNHKNVVTWEVL